MFEHIRSATPTRPSGRFGIGDLERTLLTRSGGRTTCKAAVLFLLACFSVTVRADWTGLGQYGAIAELAAEDREIRLTLTFAESAVPRLARLAGLPEQGPRLEDLALRLLRLEAPDAPRLQGRLVSLASAEADRQATHTAAQPTTPGRSFEAVVIFPLEHRLTRLSVIPAHGASGTKLGLIVLHHGVPLNDLTGFSKPLSLRLDPDDPWRSHVNDPEIVRRHNEPHSFVYVEPYEVRHELLIRLAELRPHVDQLPAQTGSLTEEQRRDLREKVAKFLLTHNPVRVDGAELPAQLDRIDFVRYTRQGVQPIDPATPLDARAALVGAVLVYLTQQPARSVRMTWDLFDAGAERRPVSLIQGQETFDSYVTRERPSFDWSRDDVLDPLPEPETAPDPADSAAPANGDTKALLERSEPAARALAVAIVLLSGALWLRWRDRPGATLRLGLAWGLAAVLAAVPSFIGRTSSERAGLPEHDVGKNVQALLHNAYRAFQIRSEEAAYDRLALSLDGDLLDDIYLQQRRTLLRQSEGLGGEGRVHRVEMIETRLPSGPCRPLRCEVESSWIAHGTVSHWGHSHDRRNAYSARLRLQADGQGQWRITALSFLDGKRLGGGSGS